MLLYVNMTYIIQCVMTEENEFRVLNALCLTGNKHESKDGGGGAK